MNPVRRHLSSPKVLRKEGSKRRVARKSLKSYCCSRSKLRETRVLKKYFLKKRIKSEPKRTKG